MGLGHTHLPITRLGLGTVAIAGYFEAVSEEQALDTVSRALRDGVRLFDTAPAYGDGVAEERLGRALRLAMADGTVAPEETVVCTKVGYRLGSDSASRSGTTSASAAVVALSRDDVLRSIDSSLRRLGIDSIDVVHVHNPAEESYRQVLDEAHATLVDLRSQGVIGGVGAGATNSEVLVRLARDGDFDCFMLAGRYTLLDQSAHSELLPLCSERRISVLAGGVLNSGILADPENAGAPYNWALASDDVRARARRLAVVCARHGVPLVAAALQFPLAHDTVSAVVVGAGSPGEQAENAALLDVPIPPALWSELRDEGLLPAEVPTP